MKAVPLPAALFTLNRARLVAQLPPRSLAVLNANDVMPTNADGVMGHHQNADLFYLTGVRQEETILLLAPDATAQALVLGVRDERHRRAPSARRREASTAAAGMRHASARSSCEAPRRAIVKSSASSTSRTPRSTLSASDALSSCSTTR